MTMLPRCYQLEGGTGPRLAGLCNVKRVGASVFNKAVVYKIRAERRLGEILKGTEKHPPGPDKKDRSLSGTDLPPTLSDLGLTKRSAVGRSDWR